MYRLVGRRERSTAGRPARRTGSRGLERLPEPQGGALFLRKGEERKDPLANATKGMLYLIYAQIRDPWQRR